MSVISPVTAGVMLPKLNSVIDLSVVGLGQPVIMITAATASRR